MKFVLVWNIKADLSARDQAIARFLKTGGQPPSGTTLLARYTRADFSGGFNIVESDDAAALTRFALDWTDLIEARFHPVIEDEALIEILQARAD